MILSLQTFDAGVKWRLTLVDDVTPLLEKDAVESIYAWATTDSRIRVLRNKTNLGFAGSNNHGFSRATAKFYLLLNSDVIITHDGWLKSMYREFDDLNVGIVGARLLFFTEGLENYKQSPMRPPGMIQHAGVVFNMLGQPYHIYVGWDPSHPKVNQRREYNCVTGACLMTRNNVYKFTGGLDTDYTKGNFEDVQFCLQVRSFNGKVIYTPEATLYHYAGGSNNSSTAKQNEMMFRLKCKDITEWDDWKKW